MKRVVRAGSPEIVKIAGADSSPCSAAETSFRELDDVFLQTQTRIWLGEVLHIRFDEETAIADLLSNGELLFQVSKVAWKMLLKKNIELKHAKLYIYERTSFGKSDGRYMPYPKVDSFLKICQILGLTGVDLFSPSDVVEKRDVRRVCMCIRSFSKKARSKNLNVPDFDIVTYTIAMPTDMVGGIRRNLEQSQCSSSSSNGCSSASMDPRELYRQKSPGGKSTLHYDSYSESDEAESAFHEFEFQSPLSDASYDATNFSNVIGEESPEGTSVVDGDLSGLQEQFRLDTQEQIEAVDKRSTQRSRHELKVALHSKSSSSHTECQFDQCVGACFLDREEVMLQLRNPRNIRGLNNITSSYQDSLSTCGHDPHDLDEPHAVDADEAFIRSSPTLWEKCLESDLAKCSSSDIVVTVDHPKEESMNELAGPSVAIQTASCILVNGVRFECMGSSNKSNILGFVGMVHEKTPQQTSKVNAEGKKEESSISAFQIDPNNSVDEVPLPRNCTKLQEHTSDLIIHSIDDGSDPEISDKGSSLSIGSVDLEHKGAQNGLKLKDDEGEEVAQLCSIATSVSLEDTNHEFTADNFSFPQASNSEEVNLCDSAVSVSDNDRVAALIKAASEVNEDSDGKQSLCAEIGTSHAVPTVCVDSYTDNGRTYSADTELISLTISNNRKLGTSCHTMSCSDSGSGKNDLVLSNQLDSISGLSNMQCKNCFNCNPISDCNGNEPKICGSRDCYTLEEEDHSDSSTCDLEADADDHVNNPIMSIMHEDMGGNGNGLLVGKSNICINTTLNISENQLGALPCNSQTDGAMKMKIPQEKDTSYHLNDTHKNASVECIENYTEKSSIDDSDCDASGRESREQIPPPTENGIAEKEVLGLGPCLIDNIKKHEAKTEETNSSDESKDIHNVSLETPFQDGAPEATFTHDPVHNSMTRSISSSCVKDVIQNHNIPSCSIPACTAERKICAKEGCDVNNYGDTLIIKENEEANDNGKIKKEPEECEKELVLKLNRSEKPKDRAKGKRVLKSVAGAMTLIGVLFLVHHIRQKREKEKSIESIQPQHTHRLRRELPEQKRVGTAKNVALYPGERLKF